jgi:hypothetical protein
LAHDTVELGVQFSNTVFVDALQLRLFADQAGEDVIAQCEVSAGCDQPHCRDDRAYLMAGMRERIAIMTRVERATRFSGRLRPRNRRGERRIRRDGLLPGGDEGDIDAPCWPPARFDISWTWLTSY